MKSLLACSWISPQNIHREIDVRGLTGQAAVEFTVETVVQQAEEVASGAIRGIPGLPPPPDAASSPSNP